MEPNIEMWIVSKRECIILDCKRIASTTLNICLYILLLVSLGSGNVQGAQKAPLATPAPNSPVATITADDKAVYNTILTDLRGDEGVKTSWQNLIKDHETPCLFQRTYTGKLKEDSLRDDETDRSPLLAADLCTAFNRRNMDAVSLTSYQPAFHLRLINEEESTVLHRRNDPLSEEEIKSLHEQGKPFPKRKFHSTLIFHLTLPGYSPDSHRAVACIGIDNSIHLGGTGIYVLRKYGSRWKVERKLIQFTL